MIAALLLFAGLVAFIAAVSDMSRAWPCQRNVMMGFLGIYLMVAGASVLERGL